MAHPKILLVDDDHAKSKDIRQGSVEFRLIRKALSHHEIVHALGDTEEEGRPHYGICRDSS